MILAEDLPFRGMTKVEVRGEPTQETEMLKGEDGAILETIPPQRFVGQTTAEIETVMIGDVVIMIGVAGAIEIEGGEEEIIGEIVMKGGGAIQGGIEEKETKKMIIDQKVRKEIKTRGKNRFRRKIDTLKRIVKGTKKRLQWKGKVIKVKRNNCMKIKQETTTKMVSYRLI